MLYKMAVILLLFTGSVSASQLDLNKCKKLLRIYHSGEKIRLNFNGKKFPDALQNWYMKYYGSFDESWVNAEVTIKNSVSLLRENNELRFDMEFMLLPLMYLKFDRMNYSTDAYYYDIFNYIDDRNYMMLFEDPGDVFPSPALSLAGHYDEWVRELFLSNIKDVIYKTADLGSYYKNTSGEDFLYYTSCPIGFAIY
ncbi:hypothetical protein [Thaumasiovibrio subtropicus]|uniref:hypothetical protein n=1 Tax=Thaumasiovibrio subtropicus TaxID=1891207 RepID=UPI001C85A7C5|nr:hypothetical protein [Thaumasiovibrio subtropicus]